MKIKLVNKPPSVDDARRLREAQTQAISKILRNARRGHINSIEATIQRYQKELNRALDSAQQAIEFASKDKGHLALVLHNLITVFERIGNNFLHVGADYGFERALVDLKERKWIVSYETPVHAPKDLIAEVLRDNKNYLHNSLLPDLHAKFHGAEDVQKAIDSVRSRVKMYGHYVWVAAEASYRLALKDFAATHAKTVAKRAQ